MKQQRRIDLTSKPKSNATVVCSYSYLDADGNQCCYRHAFEHAPEPYAEATHRAFNRSQGVSLPMPHVQNRVVVFNDSDSRLLVTCEKPGDASRVLQSEIPPKDMFYFPCVPFVGVVKIDVVDGNEQNKTNQFRVFITQSKTK